MVTDPISDLITRLINASRVHKETVSLPFSQMKFAVANALAKEGYIAEVDKKSKSGGALSMTLAYKAGKPVISGVKRISKPSRRMYMGVRDIKPVKRGYGLVMLSTPTGILSGKEAQKQRVGGEVLFEIW